jgi:hypothetical protein
MPSILANLPANPDDWKEAGDTLANHLKMIPAFQNGLLHAVYWLFYTLEGRTFMHSLRPAKDGSTDAAVAAALRTKFTNEFAVPAGAQDALVGAHIAGFRWLDAHANNDIPERNKQESIYQQNVAAVSWFLWEQGAGELFPLGW